MTDTRRWPSYFIFIEQTRRFNSPTSTCKEYFLTKKVFKKKKIVTEYGETKHGLVNYQLLEDELLV